MGGLPVQGRALTIDHPSSPTWGPGVVAVTAEAIRAAYLRIPAAFRGMPQFVSEALSERLGRPVVVKAEMANPIGSFKGRGTWLAVTALVDAGEVGERRGLVVASAGNFGQGVAYAARAHGIVLTVFAATGASVAKVAAMRRLGADVLLVGHDFDAARDAAAEFATNSGAHLLVDGEDPWIAIGAGSVAMELTDAIAEGDLPELESIFVPVGNGALVSGVGIWVHSHGATRVVGVQAERAPAMQLSWEAGRPIETPSADTVADGIAARVPVFEALELMRTAVDEMVLVSEDEILAAQAELTAATPFAVEPAAAVAWAAALKAVRSAGAVALVLTGGNIAPGPH